MDRPARSETETGDVGIAHREVVGESGLLNRIQILRFAARQVMMAVVSNDEACRPLQMPFLGDDFVGLQAGTVARMQADASARFGTEAREAVEEFEVEGIVRLVLRSISPAFEEEKRLAAFLAPGVADDLALFEEPREGVVRVFVLRAEI